MFKVYNRNTRTKCEICSMLTIKTSGALTYFTLFSSVSIVNFEQINAGWVPEIAKGCKVAINPFCINVPFLCLLKTPEKL